MKNNFKIGQESTQEYFSDKSNINIGDRFSEMLTFWVTVIKIQNDKIITLEGTNDVEIHEYDSFESFKKRFEYSTNSNNFWVYFMGNKPETVQSMIDFYKKKESKDKIVGNREINIDSILYDL